MKNFEIITAVTPDYHRILKWSLPTWFLKPQFKDKKITVLHYGFRRERDLNWLKEDFNAKLIKLENEEGLSQRDFILKSFIKSHKYIESDYFVKIDADTYFINDDDVFDEHDFEMDLVSHRWGYTKPGRWFYQLENKYNDGKFDISKSPRIHRQKRIQSICCLHKKKFVDDVDKIIGDDWDVYSHDTVLWYFAEKRDDYRWRGKNLKNLGVRHGGNWMKMREQVCSTNFAFKSESLNKRLFDSIQLEVTTSCPLKCINCDRCCGTAPSEEYMSLESIKKFVDDSIELGVRWSRVDIIGGEPTYYPHFKELFDVIRVYKEWHPKCKIRFSTNGLSNFTKERLEEVPSWVKIRNSSKKSNKNHFDAFNNAPIDNGVTETKYCSIPWRCGLGLSKNGYYPCGPGASIDRVFGFDIGVKELKDFNLEMIENQLGVLCNYCGHSFCPSKVRVNKDQITSKSWKKAIEEYRGED